MTTTLRPTDTGLVRTSTYDVNPDVVAGVVGQLIDASGSLAGAPDSGLLASTVLVSRARPGADEAVRVVHLTRWASLALADAAPASYSPAEGQSDSPVPAVHDLELRAMHTAAVEPHIELGQDGPATFLISMDSDPAEHEYLVQLNLDDTEAIFGSMPGFVAGAFFSAVDRERLFEVVQWKTMGDFVNAATSPGFAQHNALIQRRCHATDARPYDVVHSTEGAAWPSSPRTQG